MLISALSTFDVIIEAYHAMMVLTGDKELGFNSGEEA